MTNTSVDMTASQKRSYLLNHGNVCPDCGSHEIGTGRINVDGPEARQPVECKDCGREWEDVYKLVDVAWAPAGSAAR